MRKRIQLRRVDPYTRALQRVVGLAVRFQFIPHIDPHRVIRLVHAFTQMVAKQGLGLTGGTAEGKAWYFLGLLPHTPLPSAHQTRNDIGNWLRAAPEITNVEVGPVGQTFYEAFGPGHDRNSN
jgi:hypothetical protein